MTPAEKMRKARAQLVMGQPFFGTLALRLALVERPDVETAAVDGVSLFFNPAWVDGRDIPELVGVWCHEVLHCALHHATRRGGRDPERWNVACDYAINPLVDAAGLTLPAGARRDKAFADMSAEEIYDRLPSDPPGGGGGAGGGGQGAGQPGQQPGQPGAAPDPGGCGAVIDAPVDSPAEASALENEWRVATLQAAAVGKAAGKLAGALDRLAEGIRKPAVDWRDALRRFVTQAAQDDFSWSHPNRRYVAMGLYLPSRRSLKLGELVVAVDTSDSIDGRVLAQFQAELNAILDDARPAGVHVVYCNTRVQGSPRYHGPEDWPVELEAKGGGGTAFAPVFDWVAEAGLAPAALVYLTDLEGPSPGEEPAYPVLWCSTGREQAAWGEVVKVRV